MVSETIGETLILERIFPDFSVLFSVIIFLHALAGHGTVNRHRLWPRSEIPATRETVLESGDEHRKYLRGIFAAGLNLIAANRLNSHPEQGAFLDLFILFSLPGMEIGLKIDFEE